MTSPTGTRRRRGADPTATTDPEVDALVALAAPLVVTEERRRRFGGRAPAPRAHLVFRWFFPLVVIGLGVATLSLGLHAKDLVLNSRDGAIARNVTDPAALGFTAEVVPTPTLLVAQTTDKGDLVGVTIMSVASSEGGGSALFFPADLLIKLPNGDATSLAKVYADAGTAGDAGVAALRLQLGRLIEADIDSTIVLGSKTLADLIAPVGPLRYNLRDNVRAVQNGVTVTLLKSGPVSISSVEQVQAATEVLGPGESSLNRTTRQVGFWRAWLDAVAAAPDPKAVLPPFDTGLPRFVRLLATGSTPASLEQAPFTESTFKGVTLLAADVSGIRAITDRMIPYPQAYQPGARLLVEVRNGVGDLTRNEPMNRRIVAAGGQIVVLGNADAFGVAQSAVVFYNEENRERVTTFGRAIGVTNVQFVDRPGSSIEATVTIGADFTP